MAARIGGILDPARLSVNINKYALLRNSRGAGAPDLRHAIDLCVAAGAHGITIHPRMDQRHIRFDDVPLVAAWLARHHRGIELNIECEDHPDRIDQVLEIRPSQCTLVPVTPGEVTSDHGWDLPSQTDRLRAVIDRLKSADIRVSCFADMIPADLRRFADTGTDRVELYTGPYAGAWNTPDRGRWIETLRDCVAAARAAGLGVNAGHDLDRHNLAGLQGLAIDEVSIGHAQICRALEVGTHQSISELLTALGA
jgi:pyridoxine 5-phosphate synthase